MSRAYGTNKQRKVESLRRAVVKHEDAGAAEVSPVAVEGVGSKAPDEARDLCREFKTARRENGAALEAPRSRTKPFATARTRDNIVPVLDAARAPWHRRDRSGG